MAILGVVTSVVIVRSLGPRNYGYYATVLSITALIPFIISFGFDHVLSIYVPQYYIKNEKNKISFLIHSLAKFRIIILFFVSVLMFLGAPFLAGVLGHSELTFYFRLSIPLIFLGQIGGIYLSIFSATLNLKPQVVFNIVASFLYLFFAFVMLKLGFGISGLLGISILYSASNLVFCIFVGREFVFAQPSSFPLKPLLKTGMVIWISSFFGMALGKQIDIVILNLLRVPIEQVGFYNLAFNFKVKMAFLTIGMGGLAQSVFGMTYSRDGSVGLARAWEIIVKIAILFVIPITVFSFIYANQIIILLFTSAYLPSVPLFRLYLLLIFITTFAGQSFNPPIFFLLGKAKVNLWLQAFVGIGNVVLDLILIPIIGVYGAVLATAISVGFFAYIGMIIVRKQIGIVPPILFFLKIFSICLLASFSYLLFVPKHVFGLLISGAIYFLAALLLFYVFKVFSKEEKTIIKNIDKRLYAIVEKF